jgi:hypothetical protein
MSFAQQAERRLENNVINRSAFKTGPGNLLVCTEHVPLLHITRSTEGAICRTKVLTWFYYYYIYENLVSRNIYDTRMYRMYING